jgi:hypothetical protein
MSIVFFAIISALKYKKENNQRQNYLTELTLYADTSRVQAILSMLLPKFIRERLDKS